MNTFSIKDIEMLSGIKAHTLRIWEQRHGLQFCKRKKSLHRYYDNEDLKQILRIAYLYHHGYKISAIARLSTEDIRELTTSNVEKHEYDKYITLMIESSLDYDQAAFEKILHTAFMHLGFEQTIRQVFYPYLEKIGLLWVTDHVIPAHEHFSSHIIQKELILGIDQLRITPKTEDVNVLVFSPEGELHEIPLLVIRYLIKKHGIRSVYFGVNTSMKELDYYCAHKQVTHLYCHKLINFFNKEPETYVRCLAEHFPDKHILLSGPALHMLKPESANIRVLQTLDDLVMLLQKMVPQQQ